MGYKIKKTALQDASIQSSYIQDLAVTTAKINNSAVTTAKIATNAVAAPQLASNAVTTTKIADKAVTLAKLADEVKTYIQNVYIIVDTLPTSPASGNEHKIHLVLDDTDGASGGSQFREWLWVIDSTGSSRWELIGDFTPTVDLSPYLKKTEANNLYCPIGEYDERIDDLESAIDSLGTTYVKLADTQTISGVKTFSATPIISNAPTASTQAANKQYVDNQIATTVKISGEQTIAGVKTFSSIPVLPSTTPTTATQAATKGYVDSQISALDADIMVARLTNIETILTEIVESVA